MAEKTPLFGAGLVSKSQQTSSQYRLNLYAEVQPVEDKTRISFHPTPGLQQFSDPGGAITRAFVVVANNIYLLAGDTFYQIDANGIVSTVATITTSTEGQVSMIWTGRQVLFVDGVSGYVYDTDTSTFSEVATPDFPAGATTATWHDGYTIVEIDNQFAISALDDAATWSALDRADAEASPDDLVRVFADRGYILLCGEFTTELWGNVGSSDFPYQRVGGGVIERGLAAKWSLTRFRDGVVGLFQNKEGDVEVGMIVSGGYQKISTQDIDTIFNGYMAKGNAQGLAYRHSGHSFYQINFATAEKSWIYDADSGMWSEVSSNGGRHIASMSENYLNQTIVAAYDSGLLYRLVPTAYTDNGAMIEREIISRHIYGDDYFSVNRVWLDVETGVGLVTGQGSNPTLMLRVSKDGGKSYGNEMTVSLGATGEYLQRAEFRRLGRGRSFTFKVRYTDPTNFIIRGEGWVR